MKGSVFVGKCVCLRDKREEEISVRAIPQTPYDKNSCSSFGFGCTKRKALLLTGSTIYL